jgi:hypothetical protein
VGGIVKPVKSLMQLIHALQILLKVMGVRLWRDLPEED